nr:protein FAM186A-like isoform X2 [Nerophis lumbriciformis]XP_061779257.1 protein FAM186A-like isoform X2 [Nerophis lumbriciformis]
MEPQPSHIKKEEEHPLIPHFKEEEDDPLTTHIKEEEEDTLIPHFKKEEEYPLTPHFKKEEEYPLTPNFKEEPVDPLSPHIKEEEEYPLTPHFKEEPVDPLSPHIKEEEEDPLSPHIKEEDPLTPHIKEEEEDPLTPHVKDEEEDPLSSHIKEEEEERSISQQGEYLEGLEEVDVTKMPVTGVPVKSEDDEVKDIHQLIGHQEECLPHLQGDSFTSEDPQPPYFKEEEEGECVVGQKEDDVSKFPLTVVSVKTEEHEDKAPESSQLHHSPSKHISFYSQGIQSITTGLFTLS